MWKNILERMVFLVYSDKNDLLTKAKDLLKEEMTTISYTTWIKNMEIDSIVDNKINVSFKENRLHEENISGINNNIVSKFIPFNGTGTSEV